jgi:hypothetical protein
MARSVISLQRFTTRLPSARQLIFWESSHFCSKLSQIEVALDEFTSFRAAPVCRYPPIDHRYIRAKSSTTFCPDWTKSPITSGLSGVHQGSWIFPFQTTAWKNRTFDPIGWSHIFRMMFRSAMHCIRSDHTAPIIQPHRAPRNSSSLSEKSGEKLQECDISFRSRVAYRSGQYPLK